VKKTKKYHRILLRWSDPGDMLTVYYTDGTLVVAGRSTGIWSINKNGNVQYSMDCWARDRANHRSYHALPREESEAVIDAVAEFYLLGS
jgi:hypothetical protein